ncbi:branched-subunit amino acid aminotransferase/4-amino-4-deoxychorismate lyase [Lipingzhangella halophila]|uniref:Branched-subunit amino acid aminotransferase/4-amino-4-deoxychorismate lyase n=1 Tax=Lipingzhangella halophila TaxID=1783352 RepID=A0A7W7W692_9ACTN|nr:aminotransferase class IV family protein [Lipingzhangella halophila]MBB4935578.1 branched-subunit amino acid aminotransferase/4-amino-4-deoxychorismate lyase [Lipingzhangella halophila]
MAELDGVPVRADELQALALVNYGHFTSMRVDDQHVRGLSHHLDRLVGDCREVFGTELDRARVREHVRHAVGDRSGSFVVRVTVFDPGLDVGHPGVAAEPRVLVTTRTAGAWPPAPLRVRPVRYARDMPLVKHVGLFGAVMRRRGAQQDGFDDALFTDSASFISEGPTWNIAFFDGERVVWPDAEVLPGVTMRLLREVDGGCVSAPVNLSDLGGMRAAFVTSTTVGVRPVIGIGQLEFPADHAVFDSLRKKYEEIPAERI